MGGISNAIDLVDADNGRDKVNPIGSDSLCENNREMKRGREKRDFEIARVGLRLIECDHTG